MNTFTEYENLLLKILLTGIDTYNERTGKSVRTLKQQVLSYSAADDMFPIVTTREVPWRMALNEKLGYLRGWNSAKQFRDVGCPTWDKNANSSKGWLSNPVRKGEDDMGQVYGRIGRHLERTDHDGSPIVVDQLSDVVDVLRTGIDDRGIILTYWNPGLAHLGCLRPCMHTFTFNIENGYLHMTPLQRSCDAALGGVFNILQTFFMVGLLARMSGLKPGNILHVFTDIHIYDDQLALVEEQVERESYGYSKLIFPDIDYSQDLDTVLSNLNIKDFSVENYQSHAKIAFPFAE